MSVALNRALRGLGWLFISIGVLVLLYLVYSLLYTNRATANAQQEIAGNWLRDPDASGGLPGDNGDGKAAVPETGAAVAALQFRRPGTEEPIVRKEPLYVIQGVGLDDLQRGPGHYPGTALPGEKGNFAVAGHRTTYGAPFFNLDQLREGDEVLVTDQTGKRFTYRVSAQRVVSPADTWVIEPDPLDTGKKTLTLTTCNPRFSNAERLIVFAELVA